MKLRKAEHKDLKQILDLLNQLSPSAGKENVSALKEIFHKIDSDQNYFLCVAEEDKSIIGTGTLLVQMNLSHSGKPYGHVENIVVDQNHRKKGIGKEIISFLTEKAKENGCYKMILSCKDEIVPFYRGCGLKEIGIHMRTDLE